jgi:hypothetical protein
MSGRPKSNELRHELQRAESALKAIRREGRVHEASSYVAWAIADGYFTAVGK